MEFIFVIFFFIFEGEMFCCCEFFICNLIFFVFLVWYGFDKRVNFFSEFNLIGRLNGSMVYVKRKEKVLVDIFEVYVGGVIRFDFVNGYKNVVVWLKVLWGLLLKVEIKVEEGGGWMIDKE